MFPKQKTSTFLGARTIKTGIAVALSIFLSNYVPHSLPILAGVSAIICIQPSISAGIQKGIIRTKATLLGGALGLLLHYIFGNNLLVIGAAVSLTLWLCHRLKWEDGIVLASLVVMAVMVRNPGEAFPYAVGRVFSTLIGIVMATLINIVIAPPRHRPAFREEVYFLTEGFPGLYEKIVKSYAYHRIDLIENIEKEIENIQTVIAGLRQKLKHFQAGTQTPMGSILEGIKLEEYLLFNRSVHIMERVVNKIDDLVLVTRRSYERRRQLEEQGVSDELNYSSKEFSELRAVLEDIAKKLGLLQMSLFKAMAEDKNILIPQIREGVNDLQKLKELSHDCLKRWELVYSEKMDVYFLMSTHQIIFDLEEIAIALIDFSNSIIGEIK
ncbi:MAG: hypothetical protein GX240_07085 [Candidatus Atribacteria bacterium]|nr:hypothetical protein [Candidatus Atribacteria bacterium]